MDLARADQPTELAYVAAELTEAPLCGPHGAPTRPWARRGMCMWASEDAASPLLPAVISEPNLMRSTHWGPLAIGGGWGVILNPRCPMSSRLGSQRTPGFSSSVECAKFAHTPPDLQLHTPIWLSLSWRWAPRCHREEGLRIQRAAALDPRLSEVADAALLPPLTGRCCGVPLRGSRCCCGWLLLLHCQHTLSQPQRQLARWKRRHLRGFQCFQLRLPGSLAAAEQDQPSPLGLPPCEQPEHLAALEPHRRPMPMAREE